MVSLILGRPFPVVSTAISLPYFCLAPRCSRSFEEYFWMLKYLSPFDLSYPIRSYILFLLLTWWFRGPLGPLRRVGGGLWRVWPPECSVRRGSRPTASWEGWGDTPFGAVPPVVHGISSRILVCQWQYRSRGGRDWRGSWWSSCEGEYLPDHLLDGPQVLLLRLGQPSSPHCFKGADCAQLRLLPHLLLHSLCYLVATQHYLRLLLQWVLHLLLPIWLADSLRGHLILEGGLRVLLGVSRQFEVFLALPWLRFVLYLILIASFSGGLGSFLHPDLLISATNWLTLLCLPDLVVFILLLSDLGLIGVFLLTF